MARARKKSSKRAELYTGFADSADEHEEDADLPAAIHRSLERRRKRLEERLREEKLGRHGGAARPLPARVLPSFDADDLEDAPAEEA